MTKPEWQKAGTVINGFGFRHWMFRRRAFGCFPLRADDKSNKHPRIPTCTYRLQFNRWFTFTQAREIVAYLDALGVSDVYASPYFQASPESLHGYESLTTTN